MKVNAMTEHLTDETLSDLIDDPQQNPHLIECGQCQYRLTTMGRLRNDDDVPVLSDLARQRALVEAKHAFRVGQPTHWWASPKWLGALGTAAAAVIIVVAVRPSFLQHDPSQPADNRSEDTEQATVAQTPDTPAGAAAGALQSKLDALSGVASADANTGITATSPIAEGLKCQAKAEKREDLERLAVSATIPWTQTKGITQAEAFGLAVGEDPVVTRVIVMAPDTCAVLIDQKV